MTDTAERLAAWLRDVDLEPGASRQAAIHSAARGLAEGGDPSLAIDLALLAHGEDNARALQQVSEALRAQDETWDVRSGDLVATLTAAVTAATAMDGPPSAALPFALATSSAHFVGLSPSVVELPELARASLVKSSETLRGRQEAASIGPDIKGSFSDGSELATSSPGSSDALNAIIKASISANNKIVTSINKVLGNVTKHVRVLDEEVDVLWWTFGAYSERTGKPFAEIAPFAAPCVLAFELKSILVERCPLPSSRGLLSRALADSANLEVRLRDVVPAACEALGTAWLPDFHGHRLLPVLSSVQEFVSLEGQAAWVESVARWHIAPDRTVSSLRLAEQTLHELILVSLLKDA